MFSRTLRSILILIGLCFLPISVESQSAYSAIISPLTVDNFPVIHSYLEVYDGEGRFVHDLQREHLSIIEDNLEIPVSEIKKLETGVQFVLALNLGPTFAIRDSNGISRNDRLEGSLSGWAANHDSAYDDLSFLTNDGPENVHLTSAVQWLNSYNVYGTNPRTAVPSLDVLVRAIEVASDPVPRVGMGRAILLLTPPPNQTGIDSLQSIISLAKQEGVKIFIWMISSPAYFTSQGAVLLADMAEQTGGRFFAFSGDEDFPDVEDYLEPTRYIYSISYDSKIRTNEPHQVFARINIGDQKIESSNQNLDIIISPPNPIFLAPPLGIVRANTAPIVDTLSDQLDYTPGEQDLAIVVEFPDGYPRGIKRTSLYVDGKLADENLSEPFENFTWNLKGFSSSGSHLLQVEIEDVLGLKSYSIEHHIKITIQQTPQSVISSMRENAPIIAGVSVALAGGILVLVMIVGGHIQPKAFGHRRKKKSRRVKTGDLEDDTLTQSDSYDAASQKQKMPKWLNKIAWAQWDKPSPRPIAFLEPFNDFAKNALKNPIPLSAGEITFGRDTIQAKIPINDPALENLHSRLIVTEDENFTIFDERTTAGTWVNYKRIPDGGTAIYHGDIVHIAHIGLRLKIVDKSRIPKAIVIPVESQSLE